MTCSQEVKDCFACLEAEGLLRLGSNSCPSGSVEEMLEWADNCFREERYFDLLNGYLSTARLGSVKGRL